MSNAPWIEQVRFDSAGLVPVVAQAAISGEVLMVAWASREALEATAATGEAHYYSRSRQALWKKGETSGHGQQIREIRVDCDRDTVLYRVDQAGPACHTGSPTCFAEAVTPDGSLRRTPDDGPGLRRLAAIIGRRAAERPAGSYTVTLLDAGIPKMAQKVGEEAVEVVVAATSEPDDRLASESADLLYHLLVLLQGRQVPLDAVLAELARRGM